MKNNHRLQAAWIGGQTKRWHAEQIVGEELVASHTWGMLAIYLLLCPDPNVHVVRLITFHDAPEPFSGDIPWFSRKACPAAAEADREISNRWFDVVGSGGDARVFLPEELWWLKTLDAAQAYFFAKQQIAMGNGLMRGPCLELVSRLEEARRPGDDRPDNAWQIVQDIFDTKIGERMTRDISELEKLA